MNCKNIMKLEIDKKKLLRIGVHLILVSEILGTGNPRSNFYNAIDKF